MESGDLKRHKVYLRFWLMRDYVENASKCKRDVLMLLSPSSCQSIPNPTQHAARSLQLFS